MFARNFDVGMMTHVSQEERSRYLGGESISFIRENLDVPLPSHESRVAKQTSAIAVRVAEALFAKYLKAPLLRSLMKPVESRLSASPRVEEPARPARHPKPSLLSTGLGPAWPP